MGHVGLETRSLGQILEKACLLANRQSFDPVCMELCQNVWDHIVSDKTETGSSRSKIGH